MLIQCFPDGGDSSIHHIRRGDDVHACLRVREGLHGKIRDGLVVIDRLIEDHPAMTVRRIFAETDVRNDEKLRNSPFYRPYRLLDDAIIAHGVVADFILCFRNAEEENRRYAKVMNRPAFLDDDIDGHLKVIGH